MQMKFFSGLPPLTPSQGFWAQGLPPQFKAQTLSVVRGKKRGLGPLPAGSSEPSFFFALVLTSFLSYGSHTEQGLAAGTLTPRPKALSSWTIEAGAQAPRGAFLASLSPTGAASLSLKDRGRQPSRKWGALAGM